MTTRAIAKLLALVAFIATAYVRSARADDVAIDWQRDPDARQVELQIQRDRQIVLAKTFASGVTAWRGDLPVGSYTYRLRSYDDAGRAGAWSEAVLFIVTPAAPKPVLPLDGSTVLYQGERGVLFRWGGSSAGTFLLTVKGPLGPIQRAVKGTEAAIGGLATGEYSWNVRPILEATAGGGPSQALEARASATFRFRLELVKDAAKYEEDYQKLTLRPPKAGLAFPPAETVCLYPVASPRGSPIACGTLVASDGDTVQMSVLAQSGRVTDGSRFYVASPAAAQRTPASVFRPESACQVVGVSDRYRFNVSAGVMAASTYFLPSLELQATLLPEIRLGLRAFHASDSASATSSMKVTGFLLTAGRYFGKRSYSGFFGEAGLGAYLFSAESATASQSGRVSPAGTLAVGWHLRPVQQGLNFSISAGAQYVAKPSITIASSSVSGLLPLVTLLFGYAF